MKWNIDFDLAAFFIILMIFMLYNSYRQIATRTKRLYRLLLTVSLVSAATDILSAAAVSYFGARCIAAHYAVHLLHFAVQGLLPALCFLFTYSLVYEAGGLSKKRIFISMLPYILSVLPALTSPVTHFAFFIDEAGNYLRAKGQIATYASTAFYLIVSAVIILRNSPAAPKIQKIAVLFCTAEVSALGAVQLLYPQYLLQEIAVAFAMLFIYLTIQNPLEYIDSETDAYNRKWFIKVINNFVADNELFSLVCLQIEGLNYINEKFGIENGTALLATIPDFLRGLYKSGSIFRLRTARFAVIMPGNSSLTEANNAVIERFNRPFKINNIEVKLRAYMCCIAPPAQGGSLSDILDTMNYSINEAYSRQKNSVVTADKTILERMHRKMDVEQAVSDAVERRSFEVFYQPIFDAERGRFVCAEALVRLNDPAVGRISPDEFIPLAEKNGDILAIGEIVLEEVCRFIQTHRPDRYGIKKVHVNLSVIQCMQENIFDKLLRIIDEHSVPHDIIDFEITESTAIISGDQLKILMQRLNENGIRFALDDYGTGYSNQANIMEYPYATVKLDKSIVKAAQANDKAAASLKHTIAMINDLNMHALAEGVETEDQVSYLLASGCKLFQGYLYSPPVPAQDFLNLIKRNAKDDATIVEDSANGGT
ncbi:MAG: EAL domain-containing protein [Treponema sp.]